MKNFFLTLSSAQKATLEQSGIVVLSMPIDGENGFVMDEPDLMRGLHLLNAALIREEPTSYHGIYKAFLQIADETPTTEEQSSQLEVTALGWLGENCRELIKAVGEILSPVIQKPCRLDNKGRALTKTPYTDGDFHIIVFATPKFLGNALRLEGSLWGIPLDWTGECYPPSGLGIAINSSEGFPIAELLENNLYIHYDIARRGTHREVDIFRKILEQVVAELTLTPEEKAEREQRIAAEQAARFRTAYIKECSKRHQKNIEETEKGITKGEAEVIDLENQIVRRIREVNGCKQKLQQLKSVGQVSEEVYGREYDKLLQVPKVLKVEVASDCINVFTDTLNCRDPRTNILHEIGKFRIQISTTGSGELVRWFNLTRKISERNAPHVIYENGRACLGNTQTIFPQLIGNYEFAAAAMIAIAFIESVNVEDSAGKDIHLWPVATRSASA